MQLVPVTTKFMSSYTARGEMYLIQQYVIKFVSYLRQVWWFFPSTPVSSTNKTDRHDIAEILLKVALNTITLSYIKEGKHHLYPLPMDTILGIRIFYCYIDNTPTS